MAPFQVFFVRGVKNLFGRGSNDEKLAAIEDYCKNPNPDALVVFVADHISIPADVRRMEMQDKERYQRIRETMGQYCGIVELARVEEGEAVRWISEYCASRGVGVKIDADGARELVDALGGDMMMISNELEKLILYVGEKKRITLGDVETMVLAAKQRSLYELTERHFRQRTRARAGSAGCDSDVRRRRRSCHRTHLHAGENFSPDAGDSRAQRARPAHAVGRSMAGLSRPPFAADDIIKQTRRYKSRRELTRAIRLVAKADLALRSNPASKRMVLERLVMDLPSSPSPKRRGGCRISCRFSCQLSAGSFQFNFDNQSGLTFP